MNRRRRVLVAVAVVTVVSAGVAVSTVLGDRADDGSGRDLRRPGATEVGTVEELLAAVRPRPVDLEPALAPDADPGVVVDADFGEPTTVPDDDVTLWDPCDPLVTTPAPGVAAGERTGGGLIRQDAADGSPARRYVKTTLHRYESQRAAQRALIALTDRLEECVDVVEPGLVAEVDLDPAAVTGTPGALDYTWDLTGQGVARSQHVVLVVHGRSLVRLVVAADGGAAPADVSEVVRAIESRVIRQEAGIARAQDENLPA